MVDLGVEETLRTGHVEEDGDSRIESAGQKVRNVRIEERPDSGGTPRSDLGLL